MAEKRCAPYKSIDARDAVAWKNPSAYLEKSKRNKPKWNEMAYLVVIKVGAINRIEYFLAQNRYER